MAATATKASPSPPMACGYASTGSNPAPFSLDIGTTELLVVNANGGNDMISATGNLAALISLTLDGGGWQPHDSRRQRRRHPARRRWRRLRRRRSRATTWPFSASATTRSGGIHGDGSDTVEGQGDADNLLFNGSAANEIITLSANGGRAVLTRNVANIVMDTNDVETFTINALGGIDEINVNDLSGTDATQVSIDLAGTIGGAAGARLPTPSPPLAAAAQTLRRSSARARASASRESRLRSPSPIPRGRTTSSSSTALATTTRSLRSIWRPALSSSP